MTPAQHEQRLRKRVGQSPEKRALVLSRSDVVILLVAIDSTAWVIENDPEVAALRARIALPDDPPFSADPVEDAA